MDFDVAQMFHSRLSFIAVAEREAKHAREPNEYERALGIYNRALASCDIAQWQEMLPADHPAQHALKDLGGTLRILEADINIVPARTMVGAYARNLPPERLAEIEALLR